MKYLNPTHIMLSTQFLTSRWLALRYVPVLRSSARAINEFSRTFSIFVKVHAQYKPIRLLYSTVVFF